MILKTRNLENAARVKILTKRAKVPDNPHPIVRFAKNSRQYEAHGRASYVPSKVQ